MKKNLITLIAAISILASSTAVFADDTPVVMPVSDEIMNVPAQPDTEFEDQIQGDIMPISANPDVAIHAPVMMPSYTVNTVTVTEITDTQISTTLNTEDAENFENTINYTIIDKTIVLGFAKGDVKSVKDIKKGDKITVYTDAYSPAPLIMPPQYQADVIVVEDAAATLSNIDVDTYIKGENEMLVNAANTLALNIGDETEIVDREGNKVDAKDLDKKDLAVIYGASTRSIPAQTTPNKVIVLGENEMALAQIEAAKNEPAVTPAPTETPAAPEEFDNMYVNSVSVGDKVITNIYRKDDNTLMLPLREIAETLGFTVTWDGDLKAVMLNDGMYSLKIGENGYVKGKMVPMQLSAAPEIKEDDLTYVPFEYFTEVLEAHTTESPVEEGSKFYIVNFEMPETF